MVQRPTAATSLTCQRVGAPALVRLLWVGLGVGLEMTMALHRPSAFAVAQQLAISPQTPMFPAQVQQPMVVVPQ